MTIEERNMLPENTNVLICTDSRVKLMKFRIRIATCCLFIGLFSCWANVASAIEAPRNISRPSIGQSLIEWARLVTDSSSATASSFIAAPSNVRGTAIGSGIIAWEWASIPNATTYYLTIDGMYFGHTELTSFTSYGLWEGDHSLTVVAKDVSGLLSASSSTARVWVGVDTPTIPYTSSVSATPSTTPSDVSSPVAHTQSMVDPASYSYPEIYTRPDYDLVFSDEFNNATLNPYRWNTGMRWDGEYNGERYEYRVVNGEKQFYVNIFSEDEEHVRDIVSVYNPFELDGTRLAIRAIKNPLKNTSTSLSYGSMREMASQQDFLSGAIATHGKFNQKYGYFEARIKIPSHVGTFPAFWLFHENSVAQGTQRSEIDIMENLGHAPMYVYNTFHYYKNVSEWYAGDHNQVSPYPSGQINTGIDFSNDYHVFAAEWEPGRITWLIDGVQVSVVNSNEVNFESLYLKINLAMGGNWTNFPASLGGLGRSEWEYFPTQNDLNNFNNPALEIDYVRVYKKR